jgi:hypothetical protein
LLVPKRFLAAIAGAGALGLVAINALAYRHAGKLTHFSGSGERTGAPELLSLGEKVGVLLGGVSIPRPENERTPADLGLAFETLTVTTGEGIELEAWYVPVPGAEVLVLAFHGYAASKADLLPLADAVVGLGCGALLVDFRGSGGSSGDETTLGCAEAWDVGAFVQDARARFPGKKLVLYGVSMGGAACLRAIALEGVAPDALVLESVFDTLLSAVRNRFALMGVPAWPCAELVVFWGGKRNGFDGFAHEPLAYAREVRCPTLVLRGALDKRVLPLEAQAVHDALGGPKTFRTYAGVAHELLAEKRPQEWRRDVRELIASL